jgi:hypothetical protein
MKGFHQKIFVERQTQLALHYIDISKVPELKLESYQYLKYYGK